MDNVKELEGVIIEMTSHPLGVSSPLAIAERIIAKGYVKLPKYGKPRRRYIIPKNKMCKKDNIGSTFTQDLCDNIRNGGFNYAIDQYEAWIRGE